MEQENKFKIGPLRLERNTVRTFIIVGIAAILWYFVEFAQYTKVVQTTYGPIRGVHVDVDGTKYMSFTGIPYAAPPVGELRFQAPKPPEKWKKTKDASTYGPMCPQRSLFDQYKMDLWSKIKLVLLDAPNVVNLVKCAARYPFQSEDCLSLNVYTKQLGDKHLKPVLFWIHGGAFSFGDGTDSVYGPEYLVDQDIVVVTINYRLGPLGFLATNTSDASGNWGLKDQLAAMKWVQDNIANFGGDPKQVTIYGESAGGVSVHYHILSPMSRGYFQQAIASSGSPLNSWAFTDQQERFSRNLARVLGGSETEVENPGRRIQFLRTLSAKTITDNIFNALDDEVLHDGIMTINPFVPVVEPYGTENAFLLEHPSKLLSDGNFTRVPIMMGFNNAEGALVYFGFSTLGLLESVEKLEAEPCRILPRNLQTIVKAQNDCQKVFQQIKDIYLGGEKKDISQLDFVNMFSDLVIVNGVYRTEKWHARLVKQDIPVYLYYFTYDGEWNLVKRTFDSTLPGALHGDDVGYTFKPRIINLPFKKPSEIGLKTKDRMVHFIANFVKVGNPTPSTNDLAPIKWEPATESELNTMHIDSDIKMEKHVLKERMDLWNNLYKKYLGNPLYE